MSPISNVSATDLPIRKVQADLGSFEVHVLTACLLLVYASVLYRIMGLMLSKNHERLHLSEHGKWVPHPEEGRISEISAFSRVRLQFCLRQHTLVQINSPKGS